MAGRVPGREELIDPAKKHLFVFAHFDDEVLYGGLIRRLSSRGNSRFVWVTNSDGLAPEVGADPRQYARLREKECRDVVSLLGVPQDHAEFLGYSEILIYDRFIDLPRGKGAKQDVLDFFQGLAESVEKAVVRASPDIVWTPAFQGGHPEHDLTHLLAARALKKLRRDRKDIPLIHLPEYEWTILIPARFRPGYKGIVYDIRLSDDEVLKKRQVIDAYPSQRELVSKFERVINTLGKIAGLIGRGFTAEEFLRREVFSPVPPELDYTVCPQPFNALTYIGERHKGVRVSFRGSLLPIARDLFS